MTFTTKKIDDQTKRAAIASPLRMEILGLFVSGEPLAISDMAEVMNRSAGSLYHHVRILEEAGLLQQAGTRPKSKRPEALYLPSASRFEYDTSSGDEDAINSAVKLMATNFRMAERDLEAALRSTKQPLEGPDPNFYALRLHVRATPELLGKINDHLKAIMDLISPTELSAADFGPDDQHVSLTLALLPIKGRDVRKP